MSNIDDAVDHYVTSAHTQAGIQAFILKAVEVLAQVGLASQQATGDSPSRAIRQWVRVLEQKAIRQVTAAAPKQIESPTIEKVVEMQKLIDPVVDSNE